MMWTIAIETSTRCASVALANPDGQIEQRMLPPDLKTAVTLVPTLRELCDAGGLRPRDVALVAVSIGPGSFTGLRIGAMTAKTLAFAANARLAGISTLEVLAQQSGPAAGRIWTLVDGQRNDLVGAAWEHQAGTSLQQVVPSQLRPQSEWSGLFAPGDLIVPCQLRRPIPQSNGIVVLAGDACIPQAATVARLALARSDVDQPIEESWHLELLYYRPSAAEENRSSRP